MLAQSYSQGGGSNGVAIFLLFVAWLLLPLIPASIAEGKGHSGAAYYLFGLLFFLPALIVAIVIQPKVATVLGAASTPWYVSVTLVAPETRTYVGVVHYGASITPCSLTEGQWRSVLGQVADPHVGELLNWAVVSATVLGRKALTAKLGVQGPEVIPDVAA